MLERKFELQDDGTIRSVVDGCGRAFTRLSTLFQHLGRGTSSVPSSEFPRSQNPSQQELESSDRWSLHRLNCLVFHTLLDFVVSLPVYRGHS